MPQRACHDPHDAERVGSHEAALGSQGDAPERLHRVPGAQEGEAGLMNELELSGRSLVQDFYRRRRKFWARVRAQGQDKEAQSEWDETFTEFYEKYLDKGEPKTNAERFARYHALAACERKFPEDRQLRFTHQKQLELERQRMKLASELGKVKARRMEQKEEQSDIRKTARYVAERLKSKPETTIEEDIAWARKNVYKIGDPEIKESWMIDPKDAPSATAWQMLMFAATDKREFVKMVLAQRKEERDHQRKLELERVRAEAATASRQPATPERREHDAVASAQAAAAAARQESAEANGHQPDNPPAD